jgi:hypothetical protein
MRSTLLIVLAAGCNMLDPRMADITLDAAGPPDGAPDAPPKTYLLAPGTPVPSIATNAELLSQIKIFDGLSDSALMTNNGVVLRTTGKANGAAVMYWSFGNAPIVDNFVASAPLYILCDDDGAGNLTPRAGHPYLIDSIPGDARYSPLRRIMYVPLTLSYQGQLITSVEALQEAFDRGLVGEPKLAGTWRNMPVVPPGTKLEVGGVNPPVAATQVYGRGYIVELFPLGGTLGVQPLRNGSVPIGQESRLISGVVTGGVVSTQLDAQPVFQYGIPIAAPTTTFNYTPIVTELDVRLATGIDPVTITNDTVLFKRSTTGSIQGYYATAVDSYVVTTTVSNKQIQFVEGEP